MSIIVSAILLFLAIPCSFAGLVFSGKGNYQASSRAYCFAHVLTAAALCIRLMVMK